MTKAPLFVAASLVCWSGCTVGLAEEGELDVQSLEPDVQLVDDVVSYAEVRDIIDRGEDEGDGVVRSAAGERYLFVACPEYLVRNHQSACPGKKYGAFTLGESGEQLCSRQRDTSFDTVGALEARRSSAGWSSTLGYTKTFLLECFGTKSKLSAAIYLTVQLEDASDETGRCTPVSDVNGFLCVNPLMAGGGVETPTVFDVERVNF